MGYFSNGTEGSIYEDVYCKRCAHNKDDDTGCPIWTLHLVLNSDSCKTTPEGKQAEMVLDTLIPRDKDGYNLECAMFLDVKLLTPTPKPTPKVSPEKARTWWVESEYSREH